MFQLKKQTTGFHCSKIVIFFLSMLFFPFVLPDLCEVRISMCFPQQTAVCTGYLHTVVKYCCHSSHGGEKCFMTVSEHSSVQKATI